ncbi:MAG: hypothetical protein RLZZ297_1665 [Chloroflexota bacterium]
MLGLRTFWDACKDIFEDMFLAIAGNLFWCAVALPLPYLALVMYQRGLYAGVVVCALLAPLLFAIASGALTTLARRMVDGKATPWRMLLSGVPHQLGRRIVVMYLWSVVFYTVLLNIWFYGGMQFANGMVAIFFFDVALIWLALLGFLLPIHETLGQVHYSRLFRNAVGLMFFVALPALVFLVLGSVLLVFSALTILPLLFFFGILMALWGTRMSDAAIKKLEERTQSEATDDAADGERRPVGQVRPK